MQAAGLAEIKRELKSKDQEELIQLCLRLGRFKKDNKELLTYLLYEMKDEDGYVSSIKAYIDDAMAEINTHSLYFATKSLRKVLRYATKMIRYSGNKQTEVEVLLHFCQSINTSASELKRSVVVTRLYDRQVAKIQQALKKLHEDLQADYRYELERLNEV
jgi:hypothetical protein